MTAVPAWLHLFPGATAADVVETAVDKATGGHEDSATIARYIAEALTAAGMLPAGSPVVEHAIGMSSGSMQVRPGDPEIEEAYPLARWIPNHQRNGGRVFRRTVIVVDDWTEVPRD